MATYALYSQSAEEIQKSGVVVFESTLHELVRHGEITAEKRDQIMDDYIVIYGKRGFFGRAWDAMFGNAETNEGTFIMRLARIAPRKP